MATEFSNNNYSWGMKMSRMLSALSAVAFLGLSIGSVNAEEKAITMGTLPWEDVKGIVLVGKKMLEQKGYKVDVTEFSDWGVGFAALSKGNVQVMSALPNYTTSDYWQKFSTKLERISPSAYGLYQGLVVPTYMNVDSLDQLNSIKDQVHGKIIGGEPGTGLQRETAEAMKAYGLQYELVEGSTAGVVASLEAAVAKKEPIITMTWTPSWIFQKYPLKFLKDPKGIFPPVESYYLIGKKGFSNDHPEAREILASIFLAPEDLATMAADVKAGKTLDKAVDDWMAAHAETVKRWANNGDAKYQ